MAIFCVLWYGGNWSISCGAEGFFAVSSLVTRAAFVSQRFKSLMNVFANFRRARDFLLKYRIAYSRESYCRFFFLKNVKNYLTFFKMLVDTWRLLGISKYNVLEFLLILLNSPWNIFLSSFSDSLELIQNLWNFSQLLRYISAIWWYYSVLSKFLWCLNRTFWGFQKWYFYFLNELFKILNVYIVLENSIS